MYTLAGRVSNLRADDITTNSVRARWDAPPGGASSYRVYHNNRALGYTQNRNFNITGMRANSEHTVTVRASGFMGDSELTRNSTFWTAPNVPIHVYRRDLRHSQVTFEWRTPEHGASNYRLYLDGRYNTTVRKTSGVIRHTITGLRELTEYRVNLVAVGPTGVRSSDTILPFTTPAAPPQPPTGLSISNITHNAATLHWSRPSGQVTGYRIYRSNGTFLGSVSGATNTSFRITGLAASAQHSVFVVATGPGGRSNNSATFSFRTLPAPNGGGGGGGSGGACSVGGFNSMGQWVFGENCNPSGSGTDSPRDNGCGFNNPNCEQFGPRRPEDMGFELIALVNPETGIVEQLVWYSVEKGITTAATWSLQELLIGQQTTFGGYFFSVALNMWIRTNINDESLWSAAANTTVDTVAVAVGAFGSKAACVAFVVTAPLAPVCKFAGGVVTAWIVGRFR